MYSLAYLVPHFIRQASVHERILYALAVIFVAITVVGAWLNYSPVPFWDMWNGTLEFYIRASGGDIGAWLEQHNEHRIIIARLLFYIDNEVFNGRGAFLIITNLALLFAMTVLFLRIQRLLFSTSERYIIQAFSVVLLFSWIQHDNIIWGFQSQFILAYLFPLAGFYFISRSAMAGSTRGYAFIAALVFLVGSIGTMGNGAIALPLAIVQGLVLRLSVRRIIMLLLVTLITLGLHVYYYQTPQFHMSAMDGLRQHPMEAAGFLFNYLGSPFYYMFKLKTVSVLCGIVLTAGSLAFTYRCLFSSDWKGGQPLVLVLLFMLAYVGVTAFATSGARIESGLGAATSSRYMTPSLVAWVSFTTLVAYYFGRVGRVARWLRVFVIVVPILLLPSQSKAIRYDAQELYERYVSVLALELGVNDPLLLSKVFPFPDWLRTMAASIKARDISIFRDELFSGVEEAVGSDQACKADTAVPGYLDRVEELSDDGRYERVIGWMLADIDASPLRLDIIDDGGIIVGAALTGSARPDVALVHGSDAGTAGFIGYLKKGEALGTLRFVDCSRGTYFEKAQ